MDDWTTFSAILAAFSTAFMALVILGTAIFAVKQLREISRARKLTGFLGLYQFLQQEEIRKARGVLMGISRERS